MSKQARWQDFLAKFDFTLQYKLGHANVVADTLSHQETLASLAVTSIATRDIVDAFRSTYLIDPSVK